MANRDQIYFCVLGDLAFFYDSNSLGNRHIRNNIRILLVNNGKGTEFKLDTNPGSMFEDKTDSFIAAAGHYGKKSPILVQHYAQDLGFEYMAASTKKEYLVAVERFITPELTDRPMVFEVFTEDEDENTALRMIRTMESDERLTAKRKVKDAVKGIIGDKGVRTFKKMLGQ